jgi:two-component system, OmpR family, phosphate regulon sensor histidine kinase PhoR
MRSDRAEWPRGVGIGSAMKANANAAAGFVQDEIIVCIGCDSSTAYLVRRQIGADIAEPRDAAPHGGSDFCAMLLAIASHDLRQPLQVIMAAHDALEMRFAGQPELRQLARIARATSQISERLELLLQALRLRESTGRTELEPVWLDAVLGELIGELAGRARQRSIELRVAGARARVWSQPALFSGMLRNLMRNAIDYTPPGGRVFVGCRRRGTTVHIEVRDSGAGIPHRERENIFYAFRRGTTNRPGGLGLGLFIVKRTADFLGHRIELRSAADRGSCFAVIADAYVPTRDAAVQRRRTYGSV